MSTAAAPYSEVRYLHAKRSVDDRALNVRVLESLRTATADLVSGLPHAPRVLELGAGVGTMVSRLADAGWLGRAAYTLLDRDAVSLDAAREHLRDWAGRRDGATVATSIGEGRLGLRGPGIDLAIQFVQAEVFDWLERSAAPPHDLIVANAFLDLVDVRALLPLLWKCVGPGRPFWFSINFDGETIFLPEMSADAAVLGLYHRTMDQRVRHGRRAGESRTGRHLLQHLPESGARVVAAGSSDWVVWPARGGYPHDEGYFLHHIVHTIDVALTEALAASRPAAVSPGVRPPTTDELALWIAARHAQIDAGELVYIAHQLDVTGAAPAGAAAG